MGCVARQEVRGDRAEVAAAGWCHEFKCAVRFRLIRFSSSEGLNRKKDCCFLETPVSEGQYLWAFAFVQFKKKKEAHHFSTDSDRTQTEVTCSATGPLNTN